MADINVRNVLNYITFGISAISGCFIINWFATFYYLRDLTEISRRRPKVTLLIGFLCICGTFISHNVNLIVLNFDSIEYIPYSNLLSYILIYSTTSGCYHLVTYRVFMVYYDIKWNKAMEDAKWRLFIDPNETNWFLKNKNKWGSKKRILFISFAHWLFWAVIGCASIIIKGQKAGPNSKIAKLTIGAAGTIIITIDTILYCKMPSFNDIYYIHKETKLLLRYKIIFVISFFIITLVLDAQPYSIKYVFLGLLGILSYFGFVLIIFYFVIKTFKLPTNPYHAKLHVNTEFIEVEKSRSCASIINESSRVKTVYVELKEMLETKHGFNCFARHLTKQWCLENLLYFVETQQWLNSLKIKKKYQCLVENIGDMNDSKQLQDNFWCFLLSIEFPENAPKSGIIDNNNLHAIEMQQEVDIINNNYPTVSEYLQCIKLFRKYISNEAYFCINVDGYVRNKLYQQFGYNSGITDRSEYNDCIKVLKNKSNIDINQLFHIFDGCRAQIYQLLTFAYSRFKETNDFQQLQQIMIQ